jgi:hypothetical protein
LRAKSHDNWICRRNLSCGDTVRLRKPVEHDANG